MTSETELIDSTYIVIPIFTGGPENKPKKIDKNRNELLLSTLF